MFHATPKTNHDIVPVNAETEIKCIAIPNKPTRNKSLFSLLFLISFFIKYNSGDNINIKKNNDPIIPNSDII